MGWVRQPLTNTRTHRLNRTTSPKPRRRIPQQPPPSFNIHMIRLPYDAQEERQRALKRKEEEVPLCASGAYHRVVQEGEEGDFF